MMNAMNERSVGMISLSQKSTANPVRMMTPPMTTMQHKFSISFSLFEHILQLLKGLRIVLNDDFHVQHRFFHVPNSL